jgi:cytochrome c oxidase assembly protein subunit 11
MQRKSHKTLLWITALPMAMFAFGFALVPIYDVFCRITGLNGKVNTAPLQAGVTETSTDSERQAREIRVQFVTQNNQGMPWEFGPVDQRELEVMTGSNTKALFRVTNSTDHFMKGQAIPSVTPSEAARYFHKIQCFCFNRQELNAGESLDMGVVFTVDKDLPEHIHTITLAYTLFDVTLTASN